MPLRYSIRTMVLFCALLLVVLSHVVLAIRHHELQREHAELQWRLGAIQRQDSERVYMRRVVLGAPADRKWQLFLPDGKRYELLAGMSEVPQTGPFRGTPYRLLQVMGTGQEITVYLGFQEVDSDKVGVAARVKLPHQTIDASFDLGPSHRFLIKPNETNGYLEGDTLQGQTTTVVEDENQVVELVRLRKSSRPPAASAAASTATAPGDGFMLWLKEIQPEGGPAAADPQRARGTAIEP